VDENATETKNMKNLSVNKGEATNMSVFELNYRQSTQVFDHF
jgi:hypothetical protein